MVKEGDQGLESFTASDGWLTNFMQRNGVGVIKFHGEATAVSVAVADEWKEKLKTILAGYSYEDVFNADELGLFYKMLPSQTLAVKKGKLNSGKSSKIRVTLLVGANASGNEKLPLLIIGKSAKPRCFKGIKKTILEIVRLQ